MKNYKFPKGFLWGGASWACGYEGSRFEDNKSTDVWDTWYQKEPHRFYNQIGPDQTLDFYTRYKEYIKLMADMNCNSFRFSISWARFIPDGIGEINQKAKAYYQDVITTLKQYNITPIICLWHFDLPQCMQDIGGFANKKVIDYFASYCEKVFECFADQIPYFVVLNEVGVLPQGGYLYDFQPPNEIDFKKAIQVGYNLLLAQASVITLYHDKKYSGEIGTVLNPNPVYAKSDAKEDIEAAHFLDMIRERFYMDVSIKGELPKDFLVFCKKYNLTPTMTKSELTLFKKGVIDFLGVNYYQPCRVQAPIKNYVPKFYPEDARENMNGKTPTKGQLMPEKFYSIYDWPQKKMNFSRGWEIYPKGIYDTLMRLKNDYGNIKCYIGENGMGVENEEQFIINNQVQDDYRIQFYQDHLYYLHKAISEGCNCFGYHVWSPFDCWSPVNAFKNRYGFYRFELSDKSLHIKKSGLWASQLFASNTLSIKEDFYDCY